MKQEKFNTIKGEFLLVDMDFDSVLDKYKGLKFTFMYPLKHISELEASEIVDNYNGYYNTYTEEDCGSMTKSAIESLHSLLKSKGIHLFENPTDFPECIDGYPDAYLDAIQEDIHLSEQKTFYKPYIFKIK